MHLSAVDRAAIQAEIDKLDTQIAAFETAYLAAAANSEIEEYQFDSGDGRQRVERRSPKEIRVEIDSLQAKKSRLVRKLSGSGSVNMSLRRRGGRYGHY